MKKTSFGVILEGYFAKSRALYSLYLRAPLFILERSTLYIGALKYKYPFRDTEKKRWKR